MYAPLQMSLTITRPDNGAELTNITMTTIAKYNIIEFKLINMFNFKLLNYISSSRFSAKLDERCIKPNPDNLKNSF